MVQGCLRARGIRIQHFRIRSLMRFLDPEGTVERWRNTIKRRVYSVSGPNALWHIDDNHKLMNRLTHFHQNRTNFSSEQLMAMCKSLVQAQSSIQCIICVLLNCCSIVTCIRGKFIHSCVKLICICNCQPPTLCIVFLPPKGFQSLSLFPVQLEYSCIKYRSRKGPHSSGPTWYQG